MAPAPVVPLTVTVEVPPNLVNNAELALSWGDAFILKLNLVPNGPLNGVLSSSHWVMSSMAGGVILLIMLLLFPNLFVAIFFRFLLIKCFWCSFLSYNTCWVGRSSRAQTVLAPCIGTIVFGEPTHECWVVRSFRSFWILVLRDCCWANTQVHPNTAH